MMGKNEKRLKTYSALEIANICGVVNQTAINWIKSGHLKAFVTPGGQYRVYPEHLLDFLQSRQMKIPEELASLVSRPAAWSRILIVDEDRERARTLKEMLTAQLPGFQIEQACDGYETGRLLAGFGPAIFVVNLDLHETNGASLCQRIRRDAAVEEPLILTVARDSAPSGASPGETDAESLCVGPCDPGAVSHALLQRLERS